MKTGKKWITGCMITGSILLLFGAASFITGWSASPYIFCIGALIFASTLFANRYKGNDWFLKRLRNKQLFGAALLLITGVLMFTTKHNEWILSLTISALFFLSSAFHKTKGNN